MELLLGWLSESSFKEGMVRMLPTDVLVPRKFGEFGRNDSKQWHESGIVYTPRGNYLLTIMTNGRDTEKQRLLIAEISKTVYEHWRD